MRAMVPYIFDARTPRERVEEDVRRRLTAHVPNEGYLAQLRASCAAPAG